MSTTTQLLNNMSVVKTFRSSPYYYVIDIFHSLPHLNMWFALSDSAQFDPNDYDYLETILFWSTACILLLIFILLVLIIYACCLVVFTSNTSTIKLSRGAGASFSSQSRYFKKATSLTKYKTSVVICVCMLCVSLAAIVYGSEKFHHSFGLVTNNIRHFSNYFTPIGQQTAQVKDTLAYLINTTLVKYERDLNVQINAKAATDSRKELYNIKQSLNESYASLETLNQFEHEKNAYNYFLKQLELSEQTRWAIMIGIVTGNMLLIVILIIGLFRNSKGSLCFFAFSGVLSLILVWILNAFYLAITVFFADYCSSPDHYILTVAEKNQMKNMVQYFTTCASPSSSSMAMLSRYSSQQQVGKYAPFKHELNRANSKLRTALTLYNDNLVSMSRQVLGEESMAYVKSYGFQKTIESIEESLDKIRSMISCEQTSTSYRHAVNNLCTNSLLGLAIVVVAGFVFGLVIPILICIIPQMWRRMHAKDYFDYHHTSSVPPSAPATDPPETHPFLYANGTTTNGLRNTITTTAAATSSAVARQFNESPSFQRLAHNSSSINSNTTQTTNTNNNNNMLMAGNLATISRNNRFNTMNQPRTNPYATNNSSSLVAAAAAANNSLQSYSQTLKMNHHHNNNTSRLMNDYLHQPDPYQLLNSSNGGGYPSSSSQNAAPLPPPPPSLHPPSSSSNGNYFNQSINTSNNIPKPPPEYNKYSNNHNNNNSNASYSTYAASNALQSSSINVPIVLYPNYRTLSLAASRKYNNNEGVNSCSNGGTTSNNHNMISNYHTNHHHIHVNPYGTLAAAKHL